MSDAGYTNQRSEGYVSLPPRHRDASAVADGASVSAWAAFYDPLRRYVGKRVRDTHAAADITQDVMLKVAARLDSLPPAEKLPAWLFEIARNAIIDHYRARSVRLHADVAAVDPPVEPDDPDEHQQLAGCLGSCLQGMIEHLPEPYREALRQADMLGMGQQEIADRAGISLSGAKSRVQRARQQLRQSFLKCCHLQKDRRGRIIDYRPTDAACRSCDGGDAGEKCG